MVPGSLQIEILTSNISVKLEDEFSNDNLLY